MDVPYGLLVTPSASRRPSVNAVDKLMTSWSPSLLLPREREREDKNETQFDVVMFSTKWEQLLETALLPCVIYSSSAFYISRPLIFTEVSVLCLITQPCLTLCKPMYCIPPGMYCAWNSPGKNTGVGSCSLLQVIFPTQGSNWGLLHCRRILYQLSYQGSWYGTEVP